MDEMPRSEKRCAARGASGLAIDWYHTRTGVSYSRATQVVREYRRNLRRKHGCSLDLRKQPTP